MTVQPRYLTGDPAGIKQFIDKFDVSEKVSQSHIFAVMGNEPKPLEHYNWLTDISLRSSCSTAMVCNERSSFSLQISLIRPRFLRTFVSSL